jgi:hypothetical protein
MATGTAALADEPASAPAPAPVAQTAPAGEAAPDPSVAVTPTPAPAEAAGTTATPEEAVATKVETPAAAVPLVQVNAFASTSYSYNFNKPVGKLNGIRTFDDNDRTLRLDGAEVVLQHAVADANSFGFRLDVVAGAAIPRVEASCGLFKADDCSGAGADIDLQQAFVSYMAKDGLRFDVGKFITHMGYEVIEGYDGYNDNYSHSYAFGFSIPFTHTGLKISRPFGDKLAASLLVVNGWDNVKDLNGKPSIGAQVVLTPSPMFQVYLNAIGGPERNDESDDLRTVLNAILIAKPIDKTTLVLDTTFGTEANAAVDDAALMTTKTANWYGAALYVKQQLAETFALTLRGEYFADDTGVRTATLVDTKLLGLTLTPSWAVASGFVVRGDVRFDKAFDSAKVFPTDVPMVNKDSQMTVALNVLAAF